MSVPILSFFTGGGLFDLGFERSGFDVVWTNELNSAFADMYEYAMSGWRLAEGRGPSAAKVTNRKPIQELTSCRVLTEAFPFGTPEMFGAIGGPPCIDFSAGGLNEGSLGEHGQLTWTFVDLICKLRPTFFVIENVQGLARAKKHKGFLHSQLYKLEQAGYAVDWEVLNALEYGTPQERFRLFVVGVVRPVAEARLSKVLIGGVRGWFPWPVNPRYSGAKSCPWPRISPFGGTPMLPKEIPVELTVYHSLKNPTDAENAPNGNEVFNAYSKRFTEIPEGDVHGKSFKRLHRYRYSPTAWYGNNEVHLHPWHPRRLSVREALRIQSAPDSYVLPEDVPLQHKYKLICNGVPCRLSESLGCSVMDFLCKD